MNNGYKVKPFGRLGIRPAIGSRGIRILLWGSIDFLKIAEI